jgi:hypothetical protein
MHLNAKPLDALEALDFLGVCLKRHKAELKSPRGLTLPDFHRDISSTPEYQ